MRSIEPGISSCVGWAKAHLRRAHHDNVTVFVDQLGGHATLCPPYMIQSTPMEWTDEGIVLGVRRHGESWAIVERMTRGHGRHLGLVRGGSGSRMRPLLQPGNSVRAVWRARLDEHLGTYLIEGTRLRAATVLASSHAVYGVTHLAALARLLPERDPHEDIYDMLDRTLNDFDDIGEAAVHLVKFELAMLAELGFGLDLETCAATGETTELIYV